MRHPLHPASVHFPIVCWTFAVIADFSSLFFGELMWHWSTGQVSIAQTPIGKIPIDQIPIDQISTGLIAIGLLSLGCVTALVAMLAGLLELARVPEAAMRDTYLHMSAMLLAFILFTTRLLLGLDAELTQAPEVLVLVLDFSGFTLLLVGGWLGGKLVYGHGVGRE